MAAVGARWKVSRSTVGRAHRAWVERTRSAAAAPPAPEPTPAPVQPSLPGFVEPAPARRAGSPEESNGREDRVAATEVASAPLVQHAGTWLMIALVAQSGLHEAAETFGEGRTERASLRIALDAVIAALAIGERCVEGMRRLATPSGGVLLQADHAPAATWVRRVLGAFATESRAAQMHLRMLGHYVRSEQSAADEPVTFYVDNHLRPYTGERVLRRGWRMQDKRAVPGCTDLYVHDEDGRPVYRFAAPAHDSLTSLLGPVARLLRDALGAERRLLLAFDREGAFPNVMAELRDEGVEWVTYERKPYKVLAASAFTETVTIDGEAYGVFEHRRNLGHGRGRVRRVAVRLPDGHQLNLLAVSGLPATTLLETMKGRWSQENGLKHGVERWGINQLDGRSTEPYPADTVVPNPARRRFAHALRLARAREGDARRKLARLEGSDETAAAALREQNEKAVAEQTKLEARMPSTPTHAPLAETELAEVLVRHRIEYKLAIDTVRIACANAEAELAERLAPHLRRPEEARRALRNLMTAPGRVRAGTKTIAVELMPAGTRSELAAFEQMLDGLNRQRLSLPGDSEGRRLRFSTQLA